MTDLMELLQASLDAATTGFKPTRRSSSRRGTGGPSRTSRARGAESRPHGRGWLLEHSKDELLEMAQHEGVHGRSTMTKEQLAEALAK